MHSEVLLLHPRISHRLYLWHTLAQIIGFADSNLVAIGLVQMSHQRHLVCTSRKHLLVSAVACQHSCWLVVWAWSSTTFLPGHAASPLQKPVSSSHYQLTMLSLRPTLHNFQTCHSDHLLPRWYIDWLILSLLFTHLTSDVCHLVPIFFVSSLDCFWEYRMFSLIGVCSLWWDDVDIPFSVNQVCQPNYSIELLWYYLVLRVQVNRQHS